MRKIELWFHNGEGPWADRVDKIIRIVSDLTHVEAKFENGYSWSSTQKWGDFDGVRWEQIQYSHPERWEVVTLLVTDEEYDEIMLRCEILAAMGIRYDMRGAIGTTLTGQEDAAKLFCSEAVYLAVLCQWLPEALCVKMHPSRLYEIAVVVAERLADRYCSMGDTNVDSC